MISWGGTIEVEAGVESLTEVFCDHGPEAIIEGITMEHYASLHHEGRDAVRSRN